MAAEGHHVDGPIAQAKGTVSSKRPNALQRTLSHPQWWEPSLLVWQKTAESLGLLFNSQELDRTWGGEAFVTTFYYLGRKDHFLPLAFDGFRQYFGDEREFEVFVDSIQEDREKDRFLRISSFYKYLIKDGNFGDGTATFPDYIRSFGETGSIGLMSKNKKQIVICNLTLRDFERFFQHGILKHYRYAKNLDHPFDASVNTGSLLDL
jgi:hypothetical protein